MMLESLLLLLMMLLLAILELHAFYDAFGCEAPNNSYLK